MKKWLLFLIVLGFSSFQGAFAESPVTQEAFEKWLKLTSIAGYTLDEESFENYDDKEFSASYTSEKDGKLINLTVKIVPIFNPEDEKDSNEIENFSDLSNEKGRIFFYSFKKMSLSSIIMGLPEQKVSLNLTSSPKLSPEQMQTILNAFDTAALK